MNNKKLIIIIIFTLLVIGNITLIFLNIYKDKSSESNKELESNNKQSEKVDDKQATKSSMQIYESNNMKYWLYIPENATNNMPLVVYLHGNSDKGDDPNTMLNKDSFTKWVYDGDLRKTSAYILIPQLKSDYKGWTFAETELISVVNKTIDEYKIDKSKVSLAGFSIGGTGTWILGSRHSDIFERIAPISGAAMLKDNLITNLTKTEVWAFVGTNDTIIEPESSRNAINILKNKGANAKITEVEGAEHTDMPVKAFKENNLIDWLVWNN